MILKNVSYQVADGAERDSDKAVSRLDVFMAEPYLDLSDLHRSMLGIWFQPRLENVQN